jgi:hypothetical protein
MSEGVSAACAALALFCAPNSKYVAHFHKGVVATAETGTDNAMSWGGNYVDNLSGLVGLD